MSNSIESIIDPVRTLLQGFLEVLNLACDPGSRWTATDLHAAFEWASNLHKLCTDHGKLQEVSARAQVSIIIWNDERIPGSFFLVLIYSPLAILTLL